jgi:hypothetical protein
LAAGYTWVALYQAALFELNSEKILDYISKAEEAIQKRRTELLQHSQMHDELNAIEQALRALRQLREISERHT